MKKQLVLMTAAAIISITAVNAQGFQRRTVEERVATIHQKIDSAFKPEASKLALIDSAFTKYYQVSDKMREDLFASGMDRDAMRAEMMEKMKPITAERDDKLKVILTEDQMKTWKDVIEPSMRPQRGNRPPGQ